MSLFHLGSGVITLVLLAGCSQAFMWRGAQNDLHAGSVMFCPSTGSRIKPKCDPATARRVDKQQVLDQTRAQ